MNNGMGSPVFYYHHPLAFYIGSLLEFAAGTDPNGIYRLLALNFIFRIASAFTFYRWVRSEGFNERSCFYGSLIYAFFPYRIFIDYYQVNISQNCLLALAPLFLMSIRQGKIIKTAFLTALMLLSHFLLSGLFLGLGFAYAIYNKTSYKKLFISLTLGAGLAAFYWLPAYSETSIINNAYYTSEFFSYKNNYTHPASYLLFVLAPIAIIAAFKLPMQKFWVFVSITIFIAMTPLLKFLWQNVTYLEYLQFPYRLGILLAVCLCYLCCALLEKGKLTFPAPFLIASFALYGFYMQLYYSNNSYLQTAYECRKYKINSANEYKTKWQSTDLISPANINRDHQSFENDITTINQIYFPSFAAKDPLGKDAPLFPSKDGLISYKGKDAIIYRKPLESEKIGALISFTALILLVLLGISPYMRRNYENK